MDEIPERVIEQGDARTFSGRVVLANLDSSVFDFEKTEVDISGPTPVFGEDHKLLGYASLALEKTGGGLTRLVADVTIDAATEERLLAETKEIKLWPRFFGSMKFSTTPLFDVQARLVPTLLRVDGIQLCRQATVDGRLTPFGSPVF